MKPTLTVKVPVPTRGPNTTSQPAMPALLVRTKPPGALHAAVGKRLASELPSLRLSDTFGIPKPVLEATCTFTAPVKTLPSVPVRVVWGAGARGRMDGVGAAAVT